MLCYLCSSNWRPHFPITSLKTYKKEILWKWLMEKRSLRSFVGASVETWDFSWMQSARTIQPASLLLDQQTRTIQRDNLLSDQKKDQREEKTEKTVWRLKWGPCVTRGMCAWIFHRRHTCHFSSHLLIHAFSPASSLTSRGTAVWIIFTGPTPHLEWMDNSFHWIITILFYKACQWLDWC